MRPGRLKASPATAADGIVLKKFQMRITSRAAPVVAQNDPGRQVGCKQKQQHQTERIIDRIADQKQACKKPNQACQQYDALAKFYPTVSPLKSGGCLCAHRLERAKPYVCNQETITCGFRLYILDICRLGTSRNEHLYPPY